jgi:hypothetical protein
MARHALTEHVRTDLAPTAQDRADLLRARPQNRPGLVDMLTSLRAHRAWWDSVRVS